DSADQKAEHRAARTTARKPIVNQDKPAHTHHRAKRKREILGGLERAYESRHGAGLYHFARNRGSVVETGALEGFVSGKFFIEQISEVVTKIEDGHELVLQRSGQLVASGQDIHRFGESDVSDFGASVRIPDRIGKDTTAQLAAQRAIDFDRNLHVVPR